MRILPVRVFSIAALAVLAVTVAACGSSGGSSSGSSASASAKASADLPLAVGPAISTARFDARSVIA